MTHSTHQQDDHDSMEGATKLAQSIVAYWQDQNKICHAWIAWTGMIDEASGQKTYTVRTDLVGGLPKCAR